MKFNCFKIPFSTKDKSVYKIEGYAYYVLNVEYEIIKQFIQITSANYRPTDREMLKTSYYKMNDKYIDIRKKYFEYNDPHILSNKEKKLVNLSEEEIKNINIDLLSLTRVKKSFDIFIGSNSSGAKCEPLKSQIVYFDSRDKNNWANGINFSNPLNDCLAKSYKAISENVLIKSIENDLNIIDFLEIINNTKFKLIRNKLFAYNPFVLDNGNNLSSTDLEWFDKIKENIQDLDYLKSIDDYCEDFKNIFINQYKTEISSEKNTISRLRNIQKTLIGKEVANISNEVISFLNNEEEFAPVLEHAHIISVNWSIKNDKLDYISDPANCLIISPSIHRLFDKNEITYDEKGCALNKKLSEIAKWNLKKIFLTSSRLNYIKENFEHFCLNMKNK